MAESNLSTDQRTTMPDRVWAGLDPIGDLMIYPRMPSPVTADSRIQSIRSLLNYPVEQTAPNNQARGWRTDCDYLLTELDDKSLSLVECAPLLRRLAKQCEDCQGSGEIVTGSSDEESTTEPCANCKPIWDLIDHIEPPKQPVTPIVAVEEEEDDLPF